MAQMVFLTFFLFFGSLLKCLTSLKLSMVGVQPKKIMIGQNAKLQCLFDMEGEEIYSLKWYKNGKEFYRYMPSQERKTTVFDVPGVIIDLQYSDNHQLHLRSVRLETAGIYRCEVVTEAPDFNTVSKQIEVDVISLPKGPKISGLEAAYSPGELVRANCTANESLPPASLIWYINKEPVTSESRYNRSASHYPLSSIQQPISYLQTFLRDNLTSSQLELVFTLKLSHFKEGKLKLKCTAFLGEIFMRSEEVSVEQMRPKPPAISSKESYESSVADYADINPYAGLFEVNNNNNNGNGGSGGSKTDRTHSGAVKSPLETGIFGSGVSNTAAPVDLVVNMIAVLLGSALRRLV